MNIRTIEEFPDYKISSCGVILNKEGKELKLQVNIDGYYTINFRKDGRDHHRRRARLLALTFIPNPENKPIVNHIDHNRQNDNLSNLEWVTYKENNVKSVQLFPERWKTKAEVSTETVHDICRLIQEGYRNKEIVVSLEVTLDTVKHIRTGSSWKEISCNYKLRPSKKTISETTAIWVCHKIREGLSNSEILELSKCKALNRNIVKKIRQKKSWVRVSKDILI